MQQRNVDWLPLVDAPTGERTCDPGRSPDWESDWQPFTLWSDTHLTEPHWSELVFVFHLSGIILAIPSNSFLFFTRC